MSFSSAANIKTTTTQTSSWECSASPLRSMNDLPETDASDDRSRHHRESGNSTVRASSCPNYTHRIGDLGTEGQAEGNPRRSPGAGTAESRSCPPPYVEGARTGEKGILPDHRGDSRYRRSLIRDLLVADSMERDNLGFKDGVVFSPPSAATMPSRQSRQVTTGSCSVGTAASHFHTDEWESMEAPSHRSMKEAAAPPPATTSERDGCGISSGPPPCKRVCRGTQEAFPNTCGATEALGGNVQISCTYQCQAPLPIGTPSTERELPDNMHQWAAGRFGVPSITDQASQRRTPAERYDLFRRAQLLHRASAILDQLQGLLWEFETVLSQVPPLQGADDGAANAEKSVRDVAPTAVHATKDVPKRSEGRREGNGGESPLLEPLGSFGSRDSDWLPDQSDELDQSA